MKTRNLMMLFTGFLFMFGIYGVYSSIQTNRTEVLCEQEQREVKKARQEQKQLEDEIKNLQSKDALRNTANKNNLKPTTNIVKINNQ